MTNVRSSPSGNLLDVSGGGQNLTNVVWVDKATLTPIGQQNGNVESPFASVQDAIDACPNLGTIMLCKADYRATEPTVLVNTKSLTFFALGGQEGAINTTILPKIRYQSAIEQHIAVKFCDVIFEVASGSPITSVYSYYCPRAEYLGAGNVTQINSVGDSSCVSIGEGGLIFMRGGYLAGYTANGGQTIAIEAGVFGDLTTTGAVSMLNCLFGGSYTISAAQIFLDVYSKGSAERTSTVLDGTVIMLGSLAGPQGAQAGFSPGLVIPSAGAQGTQTIAGDGNGGWQLAAFGGGSQGPQGAQGAQGSGTQGPQGAQGAQGAAGGGSGSGSGELLFFGSTSMPDSDGDFLTPFDFSEAGSASPFGAILYAPRDGTLGMALFGVSNTEGDDCTATLTIEGVDSAIAVTIPNGGNIAYNTVNSVAVSKGDALRVRVDGDAGGLNLQFQVMYTDGGSFSGSGVVASAIGRKTGGDAVPPTVLYTIPAGQSGLYRLTYFAGPATTGGSGQVNVVPSWPPYTPGTGNLEFMSPGVGSTPPPPQHTFVIGEGSDVPVPTEYRFWAQEGGEVSYEISTSFDSGDWVYCVVLEKLAGFSNP